jgi:hypothetical protein
MTRGFDDRRDWAATMHRDWLEPAMAAYWDVPAAAIQPMFSDSADAVTADAAGGIDAIVQTRGAAPVFVAQRVRTMRKFRGSCHRPDFSLREQTSTGDDSEFVRLLDAYRTGRDLPSVYLFGIGVATSRRACVNDGLAALFWIDTREMMASIDAGQLEGDSHRSGTGERTRYYSVDDLRQCDCIVADASGRDLASVYRDNVPLEPGFPRAEPGVQTRKTRLQDFHTST